MLTDVIAAVATPGGRSAIALIRMSGGGAHSVAARVLDAFTPQPARVVRRTLARHPSSGEQLDDVLYTAFAGPASYTGEDMVEIGTHGGVLAPGEVLGALLAAGARDAAPGEFTRRALANGKMDLLQAEATADLVDATAPAQRRVALGQLDRGLSRRIDALRERVLEIEALVSYDIDFPEEDSGPVSPERVSVAVTSLLRDLSSLVGTSTDGERLREGALCVIAGAPNTGKSSLFNALLGHERAIVTDVAGTTRDAIEAPATCNGFPFRLIDTAGLRESDDAIERLGIEVSRRYLDAADMVLFCVAAGRALQQVERAFVSGLSVPVVVVGTKYDLDPTTDETDPPPEIAVSALTGDGIPGLRERMAELAFGAVAASAQLEPVLTRERHRVALDRARAEVAAFREARDAGLEVVVAATHLRAAIAALEGIIGVVTTEDVLDRLFATFCVGK